MVILSAFSAVLGLLRDVVIAGAYGSGAALDAYLYAQGLMNLVLALIAGAMAKAVVPPLARAAVSGTAAERIAPFKRCSHSRCSP